MLHMREQLVAAVKAHAQGEIAKHKVFLSGEGYLTPVDFGGIKGYK